MLSLSTWDRNGLREQLEFYDCLVPGSARERASYARQLKSGAKTEISPATAATIAAASIR